MKNNTRLLSYGLLIRQLWLLLLLLLLNRIRLLVWICCGMGLLVGWGRWVAWWHLLRVILVWWGSTWLLGDGLGVPWVGLLRSLHY